MATAAELEKDFENVRNRGDASHVHGLAKNVRDRIESVERSIDLLRSEMPNSALLEAEDELERLRSLLRRIEAALST